MASRSSAQITASTPIAAELPRGRGVPMESLVVLTREAALERVLKVLGSEHDIITIAAEERLDEALLGRHTGVAILDSAATSTPIAQLTERIRAQFPDLVLIVAGRQEEQNDLARQITNGTVYRFLHKPVSEQRVKLFVEAAWRRHTEEQAEAVDLRLATGSHALPRKTSRIGLLAAGVLLSVLGALAAALLLHKPERAPGAAHPGTAAQTTLPAQDSQLESRIDKLLSDAEAQLASQHLDDAQKLIDQARALRPDQVRVAFLMARLGKERERALARQQLEQQKLTGRVADYLAKAADRLEAGQLIEPPQDSARFFIESARTLSPESPKVRQAQSELADRVVSEARKALTAGRSAEAQHWIEAAPESYVSSDAVDALARDAQQLQATAKADSLPRLTQPHDTETEQPTAQAGTAAVQASTTAVATAPSAVTPQAVTPQPSASPPVAQQSPAGQGSAAPINGPQEALPAPHSQQDASHGSDAVGAGALRRVRYSAPTFPVTARERGISGWVDLQFVVKPDGSVSNVQVTGAQPKGVFEQPAIEAVRKWRYEPVLHDGRPVEQMARLRMKFALEDK